MEWNFMLFIKSMLLGIGLAMDAFSVSLANGLNEPHMTGKRMCGIAGVFAFFQAIMPLTGWICVRTVIQYFEELQQFVPWIALALLLFIGGQMILEGVRECEAQIKAAETGSVVLFVQGIATSVDALSAGFTIAGYHFWMALVCSLIIAGVTFFICMAGLMTGKRFGTKLSGKAALLGGVILIAIGLEIWITGVF